MLSEKKVDHVSVGSYTTKKIHRLWYSVQLHVLWLLSDFFKEFVAEIELTATYTRGAAVAFFEKNEPLFCEVLHTVLKITNHVSVSSYIHMKIHRMIEFVSVYNYISFDRLCHSVQLHVLWLLTDFFQGVRCRNRAYCYIH